LSPLAEAAVGHRVDTRVCKTDNLLEILVADAVDLEPVSASQIP
jgi:hypothetical protein